MSQGSPTPRPEHPATSELQAVMAVLGTLVEGSTAIHGRGGPAHPDFQVFKSTAKAILLPALRKALASARAGQAAVDG